MAPVSGSHFEALTAAQLVDAVAAAEKDSSAPEEPGGTINLADTAVDKTVSFVIDSGASHSLISAHALSCRGTVIHPCVRAASGMSRGPGNSGKVAR